MLLRDALVEAALKAGMFKNLQDKRRHATDRAEDVLGDHYPHLWDATLADFQSECPEYLSVLEAYVQNEEGTDRFHKFEVSLDAIAADHRHDKPKPKGEAKQPGDNWVSPGRLVLTWPDLDPTARLVLFTMAAHGNNKGENIWIGQQAVADYLGMSKRTIQRAVDRLEDAKAITMTAKPRQHKPPTWRINRGPGVT